LTVVELLVAAPAVLVASVKLATHASTDKQLRHTSSEGFRGLPAGSGPSWRTAV
jgi:hypothetical protein